MGSVFVFLPMENSNLGIWVVLPTCNPNSWGKGHSELALAEGSTHEESKWLDTRQQHLSVSLLPILYSLWKVTVAISLVQSEH